MAEETKKPPIDWGKRVRLIYQELGMGRSTLAESVGVSPRTVEGWDTGRHAPDMRAQRALLPMWRRARARHREGREEAQG